MQSKRMGVALATWSCLAMAAGKAVASEPIELSAIEMRAAGEAMLGTADSARQGVVTRSLIESRPLLRPGELVESIPGAVATQHSGDGKANQYFLRGFNLDHGTDVALSVAGMPVNMPSHAHGQGYADLNFVIPELVERIVWRKGTAHAEVGDFGSAGAIDLDYVRTLPTFTELGIGAGGYQRLLSGSGGSEGSRQWFGALEAQHQDGRWTVSEDFRKLNLAGGLSWGHGDRAGCVVAMFYQARWNATDQIPQRLIDSGRLGLYDSLNASDGGRVRRYSLSAEHGFASDWGRTKVGAYAIVSAFKLWSDFSYALRDPIHGDQFEQAERRRTAGLKIDHSLPYAHAVGEGLLGAGLVLRHDATSPSGLYWSAARQRLTTVREDRIGVGTLGAWLSWYHHWLPWLRSTARCAGIFSVSAPKGCSPPTTAALRPACRSPSWHCLSDLGTISKLMRVQASVFTVTTRAERRHTPILCSVPAPVTPMARSRGGELGLRWEGGNGWRATLVWWQLRFDSELFDVGDVGSTEPGRGSRRDGIELGLRYASGPWKLDFDVATARAGYRGTAPPGEGSEVPNVVRSVVSGGLSYDRGRWFAGSRVRYLGSRNLDTLGAMRSTPALQVNVRTGWRYDRHLTLTLDVFNLLNRHGNDIEYAYCSCTRAEAAAGCGGDGIADRHVHPVEPRTLRLAVNYRWWPLSRMRLRTDCRPGHVRRSCQRAEGCVDGAGIQGDDQISCVTSMVAAVVRIRRSITRWFVRLEAGRDRRSPHTSMSLR